MNLHLFNMPVSGEFLISFCYQSQLLYEKFTLLTVIFTINGNFGSLESSL